MFSWAWNHFDGCRELSRHSFVVEKCRPSAPEMSPHVLRQRHFNSIDQRSLVRLSVGISESEGMNLASTKAETFRAPVPCGSKKEEKKEWPVLQRQHGEGAERSLKESCFSSPSHSSSNVVGEVHRIGKDRLLIRRSAKVIRHDLLLG